jgi:hypothetical protein
VRRPTETTKNPESYRNHPVVRGIDAPSRPRSRRNRPTTRPTPRSRPYERQLFILSGAGDPVRSAGRGYHRAETNDAVANQMPYHGVSFTAGPLVRIHFSPAASRLRTGSLKIGEGQDQVGFQGENLVDIRIRVRSRMRPCRRDALHQQRSIRIGTRFGDPVMEFPTPYRFEDKLRHHRSFVLVIHKQIRDLCGSTLERQAKAREDRNGKRTGTDAKGDLCAKRPPSITSSRTSTGRSRLTRNALDIAPPRQAAWRSRIRSPRNRTRARAAFPLLDG